MKQFVYGLVAIQFLVVAFLMGRYLMTPIFPAPSGWMPLDAWRVAMIYGFPAVLWMLPTAGLAGIAEETFDHKARSRKERAFSYLFSRFMDKPGARV